MQTLVGLDQQPAATNNRKVGQFLKKEHKKPQEYHDI